MKRVILILVVIIIISTIFVVVNNFSYIKSFIDKLELGSSEVSNDANNLKEELQIKNVLVKHGIIPSVNPKNFEFDIRVVKDWAFGDVVKNGSDGFIRTVLLRKINGKWEVSPRKKENPMQFEFEDEMPQDTYEYYQQWDAGHY